jgi:hypothetical protein
MISHSIIIGTQSQPSRSPSGGRRPLPAVAREHARQPIPRRIPNEFYPTPPEAVRALLSVETFDGSIWEPACGEGAITKVLTEAGHEVVSTDRYDYGFGETGINFLDAQKPLARHSLTNPPYGHGLADAFMLKAFSLTRQTGGKVALLLNLSSLCHPSRTALFGSACSRREFTPSTVSCAGRRIAMAQLPNTSSAIAIVGSCGPRTIKARRHSDGCRPPHTPIRSAETRGRHNPLASNQQIRQDSGSPGVIPRRFTWRFWP